MNWTDEELKRGYTDSAAYSALVLGLCLLVGALILVGCALAGVV